MKAMSAKTSKDFQQLYSSELITALICGALIYMMSQSVGLDLRLLLPGGILIFIILQSAGYWYYRKRASSNPDSHYQWAIAIFSSLKKLNPFLFLVYPLFLLILLIFKRSTLFSAATIFGLFLFAFAILEYFNCYYFSFQIRNFKKPTELCLEIDAYRQS